MKEKTYTIQEVLKIIEPLEKEFYDTARELLNNIEKGLKELENENKNT